MHLLDAAAGAEALWEAYLTRAQQRALRDGFGLDDPGDEAAARLVAFWAGLHDLGKLIPGFQALDQGASRRIVAGGYPDAASVERLRHDRATHLALAPLLAARGYPCGPNAVSCPAHRVAQTLGGHHGTFYPALNRHQRRFGVLATPALGAGPWEAQQTVHLETVEAIIAPPVCPPRVTVEAAALATGLVIIADWLVSQESFLRERLRAGLPTSGDLEHLRAHYAESRARLPDVVREAGLGRAALRPGGFQETFDFEPYPLQASVAADLPGLASGPGLLLVMAPTGDGKTETALHAAQVLGEAAGATGIHVALPTMATADQMFERVVAYARERLTDPAALALVHGSAWLNELYESLADGPAQPGHGADPGAVDPLVLTDDPGGPAGPPRDGRVVATAWLRGAKRGLLAPISVGTIDQVLLAGLPVRHNTLRLLGLAGKVLVVDEAHAYDAYMQALLRRVLTWLGRLGVPVVVMSATLPARVAASLARAYLAGARPGEEPPAIPALYPGWVHADAQTAKVTSRALPSARARELTITLHPHRHDPAGRAARLVEALEPVLDEGGCALVVCNTVAGAQATHEALTAVLGTLPARQRPELLLLHARYPQRQRAERTTRALRQFGKDGSDRPHAAILVATQVVEQSLDLDFDLVVSDLAPMGLLLQRAGRCHRHPRARPARLDAPGLAVLVPTGPDGSYRTPAAWGDVYPEALLLRTQRLLAARGATPVRVPDGVQALVDEADADFGDDTTDDELLAAETKRLAGDAAAEGIAEMTAVPRPRDVGDLAQLSRGELDERVIATRLGADTVHVVCCFADPEGRRWLDRERRHPLPERGSGPAGRFTRAEARRILAEAIPVRRGDWTRSLGPEHAIPPAWGDDPHLADLVLLPDTGGDGRPDGLGVGATQFRLDADRGLYMTRDRPLRSRP